MAKKFFGQFLLERGKVSREALLDAVAFQREVNRTLGALAASRGQMTAQQVEETHAMQRSHDRMFGEIAVELGYLTDEHVRELLGVQKNNYIYLGEALVEKGHLSRESKEELLAAFLADERETVPLDVQWGKMEVDHVEVVSVCVDQMRKILFRICGLRNKIGDLSRGELGGEAPVASLELTGDLQLTLFMAFGDGTDLRLGFTERFMGLATDEPEMIADASREFLNVVAGNATTALKNSGVSLELRPPTTLRSSPADLLVIPHHCIEGDILLGVRGV